MKLSQPLACAATRRLLGGLAAASITMLAPATALAQFDSGSSSSLGINVTNPSNIPRLYPDGHTSYPSRSANQNPLDINYQDCADNIILQFNLTLTGLPTTDTIQVWAGTTDCTQSAARETGTGPYCWRVAPDGEFANSQTTTGNISVRNITRYLNDTTTAHFSPVTGIPGPAACHTQTTSGQVQLSLYFIFLKADGISVDTSTTYGQNVDMVGPLAPTLNVPVGIGDGLLLVNWTPQTDSTIAGFYVYAEDQGPNGLGVGAEAGAATQSSPIYCHQSAGTQTCVDSGTSDATVDGATDATVDAMCTTTYPDGSAFAEILDATSLASLNDADLAAQGCERGGTVNGVSTQQGSGTCTSSVLVDAFTATVVETSSGDSGSSTLDEGGTTISTSADGSILGTSVGAGISLVDFSKYGVGNFGGNTTSNGTIQTVRYADGTSGPLIDGHQYAIAVAAYDNDGNVGLLSGLGCQTPEPVTDFWDKYKQDGGLAGGGFCALEAPGAPVATSVFGLGIGTALVAVSRRRRRRRRNS